VIFRSRYSIGKVSSRRTPGALHQSRRNIYKQVSQYFRRSSKYLVLAAFIGGIGAVIILFQIARNLPDVGQISTYIPAETTKIYSEDNVVLAELHLEENRVTIPLEHISPYIRRAVVAMEDENFYSHHGLDFKGIARALFRDVLAGSFVEGGSTLTQQLARNLFLTRKRQISRKVSEAILAIQIERRYSKPEILEMYLNQVYWGHNAYGIESASLLYFGKQASNVNLSEAAMLVGLLTGPEYYSPLKNFARAKKRQLIVLKKMEEKKIITHDEMVQAYNREIILMERKPFRYKAPFFTQSIIQRLINMYGEEAVYTSGLRVYTTLNYRLQRQAEKVVDDWIAFGKQPAVVQGVQVQNLNYSQAALVAMDPRNGYIKALVGGADFLTNQFNHVTQAHRQPGSSFKPFVYLAALLKGYTPGSIVDDSPVVFNTAQGPYAPQNYTKKYLGPITLRKALEESVNIVAIRLNYMLGPKYVAEVAHQVGIESVIHPVISLPLGSNETTMIELTSAYAVLANGGVRAEPASILRIEDRDGTTLYEHTVRPKRVVDGNAVSLLVDMMRGVVTNGTGRNANLPRPIAGKTGTTSSYKDAWFFGFVPQLVCGTWVGNDNNTPMYKITGGWVPASMWRDFMKEALRGVPAQNFNAPDWGNKGPDTTIELNPGMSSTNGQDVEQYWDTADQNNQPQTDASAPADQSAQPAQNDQAAAKPTLANPIKTNTEKPKASPTKRAADEIINFFEAH